MDGTQAAVIGLDEILAELYSEGKQANRETADEIIMRFEAGKNFIPSSELTRREYRHTLLKEYQEFLENRTDEKGR
jgi:hypothetical protein